MKNLGVRNRVFIKKNGAKNSFSAYFISNTCAIVKKEVIIAGRELND